MSRFATVDYSLDGITFAPWQACPECSGGTTPGARALLAYWLESFEGIATSLGIYNCRPVRGASSLSIHACGRAVDGGVPVTVAGHRVVMEFWNRMAPHAKDFGIQLLIFSRTSGSARHPWPKQYNGVHPHDDHWHGELTPNAAANLTLATLRARVGDFRTDAPEPTPTPTPTPGDLASELPVVKLRHPSAPEVRRVQALVLGHGIPVLKSIRDNNSPDGIFGGNTEEAVKAFQRSVRIKIDGVVGPQTYGKLLSPVDGQLVSERHNSSGKAASVAQALLAAAGFPPANSFPHNDGIPDGKFGYHSTRSAKKFQKRAGLAVDGVVGPNTLRALLGLS